MTSRGTSDTTRRSTGMPGQHLAPRGPGFMRLLAEQVLDAQDVGQGQVAIVPQQLLGERLPADQAATVDLRAPRAAHTAGPAVEGRAAAAAR